jgi:hypothetical protein
LSSFRAHQVVVGFVASKEAEVWVTAPLAFETNARFSERSTEQTRRVFAVAEHGRNLRAPPHGVAFLWTKSILHVRQSVIDCTRRLRQMKARSKYSRPSHTIDLIL